MTRSVQFATLSVHIGTMYIYVASASPKRILYCVGIWTFRGRRLVISCDGVACVPNSSCRFRLVRMGGRYGLLIGIDEVSCKHCSTNTHGIMAACQDQ